MPREVRQQQWLSLEKHPHLLQAPRVEYDHMPEGRPIWHSAKQHQAATRHAIRDDHDVHSEG